jgi:hypothetical protein
MKKLGTPSPYIVMLAVLAALNLSAGTANAVCYGSGSFSNCYDSAGNSYTVQRFGNQTVMNGYNAETGSTWSQNSTTLGNTTLHTGETNGNSWNMTDQRMGNMRSIYGTDSRGNSFNYLCTPYGCN